MPRFTCFLLLALWSILSARAETKQDDAISLADLAASAEFIALVQVRDTDYLTRRELPVSGSAYLRVLIPYKGDKKAELIEVYEKGLHEHECYFPNPTVFEEGRRYLVFLARDLEQPERFRGLSRGCAVDVLVDSDNAYVVRMPVTGVKLTDELGGFAQKLDFNDAYAVIDDEDLAPALRDSMLSGDYIVPYQPPVKPGGTVESEWNAPQVAPGRQWRYTRGVSLTKFRELMGAAALAD